MERTGMAVLVTAVVGVLAVTPVGPPVPGAAAAPPPALGQPEVSAGHELDHEDAGPDRLAEPDLVLGGGWRGSSDRAVTTSGDETGLHVLVADRSDAYRWRTAATLAEPMIESDQWIGQLCVTGSGRRAVVVYAPRTFANETVLMERGAFAAVVDLVTGAVTKLAVRVSLAYFNPGCGAGETAVLSRLERSPATDAPAKTWINTVDAASATLGTAMRSDGQLTSMLPVDDRIVGVKGYSLVEVGDAGDVTVAAHASGQPFRLLADGRHGVAFQVARGDQVELARLVGGRVRTVATAPLGAVKLRPRAGGGVYAVGVRASEQVASGSLPGTWQVADGLPDSTVSTGGRLLVERATTGREAAGRLPVVAPGQGGTHPVRIETTLLGSDQGGDELAFVTRPVVPPAGRQQSPALGRPATPDRAPTADGDSTVPWDPDRACAVPRNHPEIQVYQPSPSQVEWAANLAVRGQLDFTRPADWLDNGLPAYSPQGMFPLKSLSGGGYVPAQVYLGILAQESNLWQASFHVVDALAGNPLTSSGFYGIPWDNQDPKLIDWSEVDCGYGVGQVTTGMHTDDTGEVVNGVVMDYTKQKAVVLDYATNIAAGLRILQDKWNQTRNAGLVVNDGDPRYLENWWFAIWAYNSGFYPESDRSQHNGAWGVGWSNNPASPLYPADREMFLTEPLVGSDDEVGYDNAKHPNDWSYPERVIGFAYTSLRRYNYHSEGWGPTYVVADSPGDPADAQPERDSFCSVSVNQCDPDNETYDPGEHPGYPRTHCMRDDLRCWWNQPITWEPDCPFTCGIENRRFTTVEPRPFASSVYDSRCDTAGLPSGARIIDDIDSASPLGPQGCWRSWTTGGSFSLDFASTTRANGDRIHSSKVDFHQIGGGFGGHFWFTHTRKEHQREHLRVTGRWTVDPVDAWARVFVHIPDHGAHTQQAFYEIHEPSGGEPKHRAITQHYLEHTWVDIGVFDFRGSGSPTVELSNFTFDGVGVHDVAWDAIAVQPLPRKPEHFVVAMGDSYDSGVGTFNYYPGSYQYLDDDGPGGYKNQCRRSPETWSRQTVIPDAPASIGDLADDFDTNLDYHLIACAGARTHHVMGTPITFPGEGLAPNPLGNLPEGPEDGRELTEIDRGFLDENTTLVLLHVGGNDAGWTGVLNTCIRESAECHKEPSMDGVMDHITGPVPDAIAVVMEQLARVAPNASIMLMGYPQLLDADSGCDSPVGELTAAERSFLNDLAVLFAEHTVSEPTVYDPMATGRSFGVDVTGSWPGRVCALYVDYSGQTINGVRFRDPELGWAGGADGSFHPNTDGYYVYAQRAQTALAAEGYRW